MSKTKPLFVKRGEESGYGWPPDSPEIYPRVTDIAGQLANEAFVGAAIKHTAIAAMENLHVLPEMEEDAATKLLKGAWWRYFNDAGRRGTANHKAIEKLLHGEDVDPDDLPAVAGAQMFLDAHVERILHIETTVFNRKYRYAGTPDLIAEMKPNEHVHEPHTAVVDWKTGGGIYPNQMLQLVAYAYADFIGDYSSGDELELPDITHGYLVHVPSNEYTYKVEAMTPTLFRAFVGARSLQKFVDEIQPELFQAGGKATASA